MAGPEESKNDRKGDEKEKQKMWGVKMMGLLRRLVNLDFIIPQSGRIQKTRRNANLVIVCTCHL